jgi:hypothetical protein
MAINAAPVTDYREDEEGRIGPAGRICKWQIAWGNGVYYLWDAEIGEAIQELPGVKYIRRAHEEEEGQSAQM